MISQQILEIKSNNSKYTKSAETTNKEKYLTSSDEKGAHSIKQSSKQVTPTGSKRSLGKKSSNTFKEGRRKSILKKKASKEAAKKPTKRVSYSFKDDSMLISGSNYYLLKKGEEEKNVSK